MKVKRIILSTAVIACLFSVVANAEYGNRHQVNVSGATLFYGFFAAPAATNDFIDVDGDGLFGFDPYNFDLPDQLAMAWTSTDAQNRWLVTSRGVGSGTGLKDLLNWNNAAPVNGTYFSVPSDRSYINRTSYCNSNGVLEGPYNSANAGSAPEALTSIDIAVMDVPTRWIVGAGSSSNAYWHKAPMAAGYGQNAIPSWDSSAQSSKLGSLTAGRTGVTYNLNVGSPNAQTIFDTEIAWVAIGMVANRGTGLQNVSEEELRHLYVTGRMPSGENLDAATREQGSGTKNGSMNSIGVDPSWARGDNYGAKTSSNTNTAYLGTAFQVSNLASTSRMEEAVKNSRLAVGYVGMTNAATSAGAGVYEVVNVKKTGGTSYVRPSAVSIIDNSNIDTGWRIGGNETMATVGDPNRLHSYPMVNSYASDYLMNINASIRAFADPCGAAEQSNMPGQYLATKYVLASGVEYMPVDSDPSTFAPNTGFIQSVNDYIQANNTLVIPAWGVNGYGKVPARATLSSGTYSDGRTYVGSDDYYTDSHNQPIRTTSMLSKRNAIGGDFYYDGQRDTLDMASMMAAYADPRNFEKDDNNGGDGYVIVELIGDYNGDGNFDDKDIRYFADGLAKDPVTGKLNRASGFEAVDKAWTVGTTGHPAGNFFNTTLATSLSKAYQLNSGWSKADIAGNISDMTKTPAGAAPMGADGKLDSKDIDYINYILRGGMKHKALGTTPAVNYDVHSNRLVWSNLDDAAVMDLSCDLNGDLIVDKEDLEVLVKDVLGTNYGDVNLDGFVNATDRALIVANVSTTYGKTWAQGDIDGDGYVTQNDLNLFDGVSGCGADINCDHAVNFLDFAELADHWLQTM